VEDAMYREKAIVQGRSQGGLKSRTSRRTIGV
jgi:hypothetical protein